MKNVCIVLGAALLVTALGCGKPDPAEQPGFNPNTGKDPGSVMNSMAPNGDTKNVYPVAGGAPPPSCTTPGTYP